MRFNQTGDQPAPRWRERARLAEHFDALGLRFAICELSGGWHAVAYLSGHERDRSPGLAGALLDSNWNDQLPRIVQDSQATNGADLYKYSESGRVSRQQIGVPEGRMLELICKQNRTRSVIQGLGSRLQGPKTWREFWMGHRLLRCGLPTPLPLACVWRSSARFRLESWIITMFIPQALPLDRAIRMLTARRSVRYRPIPELIALRDRVVDLLSAMGEHAFYHRDLKPSNVLVSTESQEPRPWLIDLDGVGTEQERYGPGFHRSLVRLVVGLADATHVSRTDYLRALARLDSQAAGVGLIVKHWWHSLGRGVGQALQRRQGERQ